MRELPIPPIYDPSHAASWEYRARAATVEPLARDWRRRHGMRSAQDDRRRVALLLVDPQRDFCLPDGTLFVAGRSGKGAVRDTDRLVRFLYRNLESITETVTTLDSHLPHQIFFPSFWVDARGDELGAHREIEAEQVRSGAVRPDPRLAGALAGGDLEWLQREALHYCERLEAGGKYRLHLWPAHCLVGSDGHGLVGVIQEARLFHAYARGAHAKLELKGSHPLTENYSVFAPEVIERHAPPPPAAVPEIGDGMRNVALLDHLLGLDAVIVAGQAASHCVKWSLDDLLEEIGRRDPTLARRIYLLEDCMSPVVIRDPASSTRFLSDFTPEVDAALRRFAEAGVRVVRSTVPMCDWPGLG